LEVFLDAQLQEKVRIKVGKGLGGIRIYTTGVGDDNRNSVFPRGYILKLAGVCAYLVIVLGFDAMIFKRIFGLTVGGIRKVCSQGGCKKVINCSFIDCPRKEKNGMAKERKLLLN